MLGRGLTLVESDDYAKACKEIGSIKNVDEALLIITAAIARNPEAFSIVDEEKHIRIAKTRSYKRESQIVSPLRIWFRRLDENQIEMLYIEQFEETNGF